MKVVNRFKIIAFTHKNTEFNELGRFYIDGSELAERLQKLKISSGADELMYLSTCNRVEFLVSCKADPDKPFLNHFFKSFHPVYDAEEIEKAAENAIVYKGEKAVDHLFHVASSLDSLVVGEREIITQVRNAYEKSRELGLTGDLLRLVIKKTLQTAKQVYTETEIARKPVSVVSLAYHKLKELNVPADARFLIIGAGKTNTSMGRILKKHGFRNFVVFNRTLSLAEKLATELEGEARALDTISKHREGFDVIVTCTGASEPVVTKELYRKLLSGDKSKKTVLDLAIPYDMDVSIPKEFSVNLIAIDSLKEIAEKNLKERKKELTKCDKIIEMNLAEFKKIFREREIELAMKDIPAKVRDIKEKAVREVFARDITTLNSQSKELLNRVLAYMEKKYIAVPMKMAKEVMLGSDR